MLTIVLVFHSCVGVLHRMDLACQIALDATSTVLVQEGGHKEIDIKRYAKVEKVKAVCSVVFCLLLCSDWMTDRHRCFRNCQCPSMAISM